MYKTIVGLEIHVELDTKSKMFCSCPNDPDERRPNINICPICTAQPGTLPVINEKAVRKVIKTGLALNSQIPEHSKFDRKNYFYPDLPKGYQISQYDAPLCVGGYLEIPIIDEIIGPKKPKTKDQASKPQIKNRKIRTRRVHLEEDTGRLIHEKNCSLVDFNRAGIPLMELVTEPDISSAKEARKFAEELQLILRYLGVSDADMEKGQMRIEANISLQHKSEILNPKSETNSKFQIPNSKLGTKVEIKNLNSFKAVEKAIEYEIERQGKILKSGKKIIQETRGWDDVRGVTISQRKKEEAHDYRYFPEPDLPPLKITQELLSKIKAEISELPQQKRERFKKEYRLEEKDIEIFVQNKHLGEYFEKVASELSPKPSGENLVKLIKLTANYLISDLQGLLRSGSVKSRDFLITAGNFAEFIELIYQGKISSKIGKVVLIEMFRTGADPSNIIESKGLVLITEEKEIEEIVKKVIAENEKAVKDFHSGKGNALQYLIGQVMKKSGGKANPEKGKEVLNKLLG